MPAKLIGLPTTFDVEKFGLEPELFGPIKLSIVKSGLYMMMGR